MNRQRKILIGLVIALLLAAGYTWYAMPRQRHSSDVSSASGDNSSASQQSAASDEQRLHIELLDRAKQRYLPPERDLFNFVTPPPPKPMPEPVVVSPPPPKPIPTPPPIDPTIERERRVQRALARFIFLGYLLKDGQRTVFLSQGESIFLVHEGDNFGDKNEFHAVSISPEKMSISQSDAAGLIEIRLIEKEPLNPTFDVRSEAPPRSTTTSPVSGSSPVPPPRPMPMTNPGARRTFNGSSPNPRSTP